jgi:hypothetical protein
VHTNGLAANNWDEAFPIGACDTSGITRQLVDITVDGDELVEGREDFVLDLTNVDGAYLGDGRS